MSNELEVIEPWAVNKNFGADASGPIHGAAMRPTRSRVAKFSMYTRSDHHVAGHSDVSFLPERGPRFCHLGFCGHELTY